MLSLYSQGMSYIHMSFTFLDLLFLKGETATQRTVASVETINRLFGVEKHKAADWCWNSCQKGLWEFLVRRGPKDDGVDMCIETWEDFNVTETMILRSHATVPLINDKL